MISSRTKLFISVGLSLSIVTGVMMVRQPRAQAQTCCEHESSHKIRVPGVEVNGPSVSVSTHTSNATACCSGGSGTTTTTTSTEGYLTQQQQAARTYYYGGGGGGYVNDGPVPTVINNLNVEGAEELVPETEQIKATRWAEKLVVIQAVCMDDSNTPHPASQVIPDTQVPDTYTGELYRCLAGTWMQITIGQYHEGWSKTSFANGQTMVCRKGDALYYGADASLQCRPEIPKRNCNERSLLRKYGAGIKVLHWRYEETYMKTVTRMTKRTSQKTMQRTMFLSGGVGNGG